MNKAFHLVTKTVIIAIISLVNGLTTTAQNQQRAENACCNSSSVCTETFPKVILKGDYPDPTILRDGTDYYMTHSPFYYMPGFLIWHSQDLVHWKPIGRAAVQWKGSAMAPDLVKHNERYYIYFPANGTNWVIWADRISGPWSEPIDLKIGGIDPGHITDNDGKRYLYTNEGKVVQLADDGLSTVGEPKKVYDGWTYPTTWKTEGMYLESPKLRKIGEYFYLVSAQGGTAGPATSHMAVVARSKSALGPWENSPYNPLVHTYSATENWWSKGHGSLIDDVNGNWWLVYHAYANGYHTLGRQTLLEPVTLTSDGWITNTQHAVLPAPTAKNACCGITLSDNFAASTLGWQWTFWKEYAPQVVKVGNHALTVKAKGNAPTDGRLLLTTAADKCYEVSTDISTEKNASAGLLLFYSEKAFAGIVANGKTFTLYRNANEKSTINNRFGRKFSLKIRNQGNHVTLFARKDSLSAWSTLASNIDVSTMNHNVYGGFYALRPALLSTGNGSVTFRNFVYKNAIPQEKDMRAYLMVFHKDEDHGLHMAISHDGYSFTALNNGLPVIAGDTIATQKGIRDPHIFRGPDGAFYLSMTDLHIYAQQAGYRNTEWERDGATYGWGNNRGLVLMKSWDLINWKRANVRFDQLSASLNDIGCVWAPEVMYDEKKGKLMIYFTMRHKTEPNKLYYVYVNEDFNQLESLPQLLFTYPDEQISAIDGDITKVGDTYHLFYVAHEAESGIKQATSHRANGDWQFNPRWCDFEPKACEAPNVWKRIGEDKWVLMYDIFSIQPHNFGFAETTDFVTFKNLGPFNEGVMKTTNFTSPKHGAVVHLTQEEADQLEAYWKNHATKKP